MEKYQKRIEKYSLEIFKGMVNNPENLSVESEKLAHRAIEMAEDLYDALYARQIIGAEEDDLP